MSTPARGDRYRVVLDTWSLVAYANRPLTAAEASRLRVAVLRELRATARRVTGALEPAVTLRVEQ